MFLQLTLLTLPLLTFAQMLPPAYWAMESSIVNKYRTVPIYHEFGAEFLLAAPATKIMRMEPHLGPTEASSVLASKQSNFLATQTVWKDVPAEVTEFQCERGRQQQMKFFYGDWDENLSTTSWKEKTSTLDETMAAAKVVNWVGETSVLGASNAAASTSSPELMPINVQEDADSAAAELGVKMVGAALGGFVAIALFL